LHAPSVPVCSTVFELKPSIPTQDASNVYDLSGQVIAGTIQEPATPEIEFGTPFRAYPLQLRLKHGVGHPLACKFGGEVKLDVAPNANDGDENKKSATSIAKRETVFGDDNLFRNMVFVTRRKDNSLIDIVSAIPERPKHMFDKPQLLALATLKR